MRFLRIGIGHCNQYSTELAERGVGSSDRDLGAMNDNESDHDMDGDNMGDDDNGTWDSDDEDDEDDTLISDGDSEEFDNDDLGYDGL